MPRYSRRNASFYARRERLRPIAKPLDLAAAKRPLWLVKVPKWVAERWRAAPDGELLGSMDTVEGLTSGTSDTGSAPRVLLAVPESTTPHHEIPLPRHFTLSGASAPASQTLVFSAENGTGSASAIEGAIVREAALLPEITEEYRRINKERTARAAVPLTRAKYVDREAIARAKGLGMAQISSDATFGSKYLVQKTVEKRKERMPQQQLVQQLIGLFREYPYWSLKALVERTQQPLLYLKDVLLSVAHLNKRGPYAGMYSVLPEHNLNPETSSQDDQDMNEDEEDNSGAFADAVASS